MENIIEVKNLSYRYIEDYIFRHLNLSIEKNKFTVILGANGEGKTTLTKLLSGQIDSHNIIIDGIHLIKPNLIYIQNLIKVVDKNPLFTENTVIEELTFYLEQNITEEEIEKNLVQTAMLLGINHLLNKKINKLNSSEKQLINLAKALLTNPKIIIIDEGLNKLDAYTKEKILLLLKNITKTKKITIVYLTHNVNDSIYSDNIIILKDKKVLAAGAKEEIYENEQIFKQAKLQLPFIIELSSKLKFYNLINKNYINYEEMVEDLWK